VAAIAVGLAIEFFALVRTDAFVGLSRTHRFVAGPAREGYNGPRQAAWSFFLDQVHSSS
jgi:hypothetical protein